jgi:isocitrate dehydrogenase
MQHICVSHGDGIGPEIMDATLRILKAAKFQFVEEKIVLGEQAYLSGYSNGIEDSAWDKITQHKILLKAPLTTPQGKGFKSANVTIRKTFGLFANVRPCISYYPFISGAKNLDTIIIRENEEDLYAGIEHRQTTDVYQCLKIISVPGCEKIARFAFDFAIKNNRKKITCLSKDNIMKITDGLFHNVFDRIAQDYPQIQTEHLIVDIGTAKLATSPQNFDVVLAPNLYGDIVSDVVAEVAGSIGLAPSANYGASCAMFEAVHGSAPDIAGKNIANPSALILSSVMMLSHLGETEIASNIHNAWLKTIEDGVHTGDLCNLHTKCVGTQEFANEVIERLDQKPSLFAVKNYQKTENNINYIYERQKFDKKLVGVDIFVCEENLSANEIANEIDYVLLKLESKFYLKVITNRGVKVYPESNPHTFCTDHWRLRFMGNDDITYDDVINLLKEFSLEIIKTENLYQFDGINGFSQAQGQ